MGLFDLVKKTTIMPYFFIFLHKVKLLQAIFTKLIRNTILRIKRFMLNLIEKYF